MGSDSVMDMGFLSGDDDNVRSDSGDGLHNIGNTPRITDLYKMVKR